ncbi:uncharacterized protein LOC116267534 isoform X2 [Nymphaea colorata]|uniref:uncharacterized protein LOC116267534 isoform X2 n=1 Tax=Nymphaea colorata TaxID=210225 RepID=UPI00129ED343|nr:uncharacterized protein LOC116267534 isoform X2 [Nymphaea colorata]
MMWNTSQNCHREFDGAIFMCNRETKKECLARGLFGLPPSQAQFVQKIKSGMILFLFEYEERKLFGVFEASSDGGIGIVPEAFSSSGKSFSSQVEDLIILFSSKKIKNQVSGDTEMHYWAMDQFKKHGRGTSPMNEHEKSVEERVSEEKVALTSLADLRHNFDICKPYFVQVDYLNKLHGQGSHSENENNSAPYRTVSAPCSDASTAADFLGEDISDLPQYSIPCLQYHQDPFSSEIEQYSKQALVQELTKPSVPGSLMLADDPMPVPYSRFNVPQMGMETSDFSSCQADFSSSDPLVWWHGLGLQDLENVNAVDNDVHYQHPVCPSFYSDQYMKRTSAFERLSFTHESVRDHENNVDASAHDLIELLAERRKIWRVPAHKKERAQHFCGTDQEHLTEEEVDAIVTLEVDDEACTSFEEADHGRRQFPNFRRRSDIRKEINNGGTSEEGDLKVDSCHVTKRRKLIRPSLSKMPSSVEHVSEENKAASQGEAGAIDQCALHLLKQHSEDGACEGLQGSFQILIGPVGCIDQNVVGQEQQKPLLQETGSNSGQLDVPQSALSVANTSGDEDENQFMRTGCLTPNPIICLGAQPEVNYQHLVDNENGNLAAWSQAIQQESISNVDDNQDGNPILQSGPLTQNATVVLADQVVVKHGHLVHDREGDLDELPETVQHESTLETVEDQSKIVQSENEKQILHTGSLPHKTQMVLAEQAENKHRHLIHDGQGDAEELSQAIHQQSTAEDVRKDESDLEQPQNGNQILQDESHPRNVKASLAEEAGVKHNYLVHEGEVVLSELSQDTQQEISMVRVQKNQDIQLYHNEDQILDTGSLSRGNNNSG